MSHIPIGFGRPFDIEFLFPSSYLFRLRVSHCWNEVSTSTVSSWWEKVSIATLLPRNISLLVNMYEKFVLACLSRQISG